MKKVNKKLAVALLALTCASCVATAGVVASGVPASNTISAKAETRYEVNSLTYTSGSATLIEAYPNDGSGKPSGDWGYKYALVEGTGKGVLLNGEAYAEYSIKQPNDFYIELLGTAANAGDVLTIDGEFYNETAGTTFVFKNCSLKFNGTTWEAYVAPVAPTQYNVGALGFHVNSSVGGASGVNNQLYLWPTEGEPAILSWDYAFAPKSADGFKINGEPATLPEMKSTGDGIWFNFSNHATQAGDIITISGVYYCESQNVEYTFEESSFKWNGTGWEIAYNTCDLGKVYIVEANNQHIYWKSADEVALPVSTWEYAFSHLSGNGITVNGEMISMANSVKSPGDDKFFADLGTMAATKEGDVLKVGGVFRCDGAKVDYVIADSEFTWDGSAWVAKSEEPENPVEPDTPVEPEVDYDDCEVGKVFVSAGDNKDVYFKPVDETVSLPVNSWDYAFAYVSGNGITVNGEMISMENSVKSVGDKFFVNLGAYANIGDIVKIGGVFRCEGGKADYVIEDREFQWTGSEWSVYGEEIIYTDYELGVMELNWPSMAAANAQSGQLYLNQESGADLPIPDADWNTIFTLESGDGLKVNGEVKSIAEIKSTNLGLFMLFDGVKAGDTVTVSGTFVCEGKATRYIIEESKFVWNGTIWERYVEYDVYEIGKVIIAMDTTDSMVYFAKADESQFDVPAGWDLKFAFEANSGVGVTINGNQIDMSDIKVPGTMYVNLGTKAVKNDVLVIGGNFYNQDMAVKYVITETTFVFDGAVWLDEIGVAKRDNKAALDEYKATFVEEDYYADEWASLDALVADGKAQIDAAVSAEEMATIVATVKAAMDEVVTKAEADAIFDGLKATAAADLVAYKAQADYRDAEWAQIQAIVENAAAEIDAAASVTAINTAVDAAKAAMDAVKTKSQWEADEAVVAAAKADLASYKSEADYRAEDWTAIQSIITEANAAIDAAIGDEAAINAIVAGAKADMDDVKTAAAKDVEELAAAKEAAKSEVRAYYNALDHDKYSEEAEASLSGFVATAISAIEAATTKEDVAAAVAQFKTSVDGVEQIQVQEDNDSNEQDFLSKLGCGSVVGGMATVAMAATAAVALLRKKKED